MSGRATACAAILAAAAACCTARAVDEAVLRGTITDAATGRPVPCTVHITDSAGKAVSRDASCRNGFRCDGAFMQALPPGRTRVRVTRGFETEAVTREVELIAGRATDLAVGLRRRVDLRPRGWYAGDSHCHMIHGERDVTTDFDAVALAARAEDLQYLSLAQAWNLADPTPERLEAELSARSTPDCRLGWNLEAPKNYFRGDAGRCLGHCWTLAMRGRTSDGSDVIRMLSAASAHDYESDKPPFANFESHLLIREQGGAVFHTHPARWWTGTWGGRGGYPVVEKMRISNLAAELPLDTVIGPTYDGLDLFTSGGEVAANAKAFALWALLLNHGYRLAATASSDACFDRPGGGVPGTARTYTFLPEGFSWDGVAKATARGRTFATTGPLVVAMLDGEPPGSPVPADGREHDLSIEAWASGRDSAGLRSVEVLRNGGPYRSFDLASLPAAYRTNLTIREAESCWFCVRVSGTSPSQRAISGAFFVDRQPASPPAPTPARVRVRVVDSRTRAPLPARVTEVTCLATASRDGAAHALERGEATLTVAATVRLRADSPGYAGRTLSPILDFPPLLEAVTRVEDKDLLDWATFELMRRLLGEVTLEFALEPNAP
jgi:hypothetical protein